MEELQGTVRRAILKGREFITKELNGKRSCELSNPRRKPTEESLQAANKRRKEQSFRGQAV